MRAAAEAVVGALVLACVAGALFAFDLGRYPLWDADEARHAEVAREMYLGTGWSRFVLPSYGFEPYREKPPGFYWLVSLAYGAGGVNAAAARSVSVLSALGTVLALSAWAAPRVGVAGALGAGLVATTSIGFLGLARYANLDMTLTLFVTLGVLAGLGWMERPPPRRPPLVPYLGAAAGMLVKGPIAVVLVAGPLALAFVLRREWPRWAELGLLRGAAMVLAALTAVCAPIALLDPGYLHELLGTNLVRFASDAPHAEPFWYYLVWLPLLFFPWTVLAWPALRAAWTEAARRPLLAWAAFVVVLYSVPRGKLATYVLPALPPLALVVGPELVRLVREGGGAARPWLRRAGWALVGVLLVGAVTALVAGFLVLPPSASVSLAIVALGWAAGTAWVLRRDRPGAIPVVAVLAMATVLPVALRGLTPFFSGRYSDAAAAELARRAGVTRVVSFWSKSPSLMFYSPVTPSYSEDFAAVRALFDGPDPVMLVAGRRHFAALEQALGPAAHLWVDGRRRRAWGNRPRP